MSVDGRGTGFRGDNFMDVVYRQLGLYETVDQIRAARCGALIVGLEKDYTLFACYATRICTYICVETLHHLSGIVGFYLLYLLCIILGIFKGCLLWIRQRLPYMEQ